MGQVTVTLDPKQLAGLRESLVSEVVAMAKGIASAIQSKVLDDINHGV
jgi:hypothetical protein